jgi:hypothetical protein
MFSYFQFLVFGSEGGIAEKWASDDVVRQVKEPLAAESLTGGYLFSLTRIQRILLAFE